MVWKYVENVDNSSVKAVHFNVEGTIQSLCTNTGQDKAQSISWTFTVTLEFSDTAIGSQISQLVYIMWQSHFSLHDKTFQQYHPIIKYFNNAINNDDIKLFTISLCIIVDALRRANIAFHGWPWKTISLLQNVIDKHLSNISGAWVEKYSKPIQLTMII